MASMFSKKVAIVTGASSGFGEAIALMFASRGAKVTMCGQDQERLTSVFNKAVEVSGGHKDMFLTLQGDVNDSRVRKEVVDQTVRKFGCLDILVPNAGITRSKQAVTVATEETYDIIMDTNLRSVFFLIKEAVPHLEKSKGNIVNISSVASLVASPTTVLYSISKIALDHLTRCVAAELGPMGIRANSINPSFTPTRILRHHGKKLDLVSTNISIFEASQTILTDRALTLNDITEAVAFLASDATAGFITGESIRIDGGRTINTSFDWSAPRGKN